MRRRIGNKQLVNLSIDYGVAKASKEKAINHKISLSGIVESFLREWANLPVVEKEKEIIIDGTIELSGLKTKTTVDIDTNVFKVARQFADQTGISLGMVCQNSLRKSLEGYVKPNTRTCSECKKNIPIVGFIKHLKEDHNINNPIKMQDIIEKSERLRYNYAKK